MKRSVSSPHAMFVAALAVLMAPHLSRAADPLVLSPDACRALVDRFNAAEPEKIVTLIPNAEAADWLVSQVPLWDCPSTRLNEIYYFRWWSFRKHIVQTSQGRAITEFLPPVGHAGPFNTIACAFGHHVAEGRWLRDSGLVDDYAKYFLTSNNGAPPAHFHKFSSWAAAALWDWHLATGDNKAVVGLLDPLIADDRVWQTERQNPDGLFWQFDVRDGMEESISGGRKVKNVRPTINSYMAANSRAIGKIAALAGRDEESKKFAAEALARREKLIASMWDPEAKFFKVRLESGALSDAREEIGYIPWMFGLAGPEHVEAWAQIRDPKGFWAPVGLTTAERRHPAFRTHGTGTCEWDGAVWPFATSQTLVGLANVLRGPEQKVVTKRDYFDQLLRYATSQQEDGKAYIGEYLDETTGQWLIKAPKNERSRYYNHSTFADLVITGLAGLVPREDDTLEVDPLVPEDAWDWFCLDGVPYHGRSITIVWDRTGNRYNRGAGLSLWADGELVARSETLSRTTGPLPKRPGS